MWQRRLTAASTTSRIGALAAAAAATAVTMHSTTTTADAFAPGRGGNFAASPWDARRSRCDGGAAPPKLAPPEGRPSSWWSWSGLPSVWPLASASASPSTSGPTSTSEDDASVSPSSSSSSSSPEEPWRRLLGGDFEPVVWANRYDDPQHAINGTLNGATMIEAYELYRPTTTGATTTTTTTTTTEEDEPSPSDRLVLVARIGFGTHLNGHGGIVHGGILGLLFDDAIGCGSYEALLSSPVPSAASKTLVTANLNIDYRRPVPEGTKVLVEVFLERWEGRKFFLRARMIDAERRTPDTGEEILYAEASSLYIMLKDKQ